jgi:hypothetical protein
MLQISARSYVADSLHAYGSDIFSVYEAYNAEIREYILALKMQRILWL